METAIITNIDIESHAISDRGLSEKRPENEDSFLESVNLGLFAVADGVGGAEAGEIASQMAVETVFQAFSNAPVDADNVTVMASAFERANDAIFKMAQELPQLSRMATTIVTLKLSDGTATVGHVGDSRIYRFGKNGDLQRLTDDHSLVGEEIRAGRLTEEEAENHPAKNVISRALGAEATVEPDFAVVATEPGEIFLLCSDGITRHVSDAEIRGALATCETPEAACLYLKDVCFERGAEDNLTAVIVKIGGKQTAEPIELAATIPVMDLDEEPTVSLSRPFDPDDDDDLLELGQPGAPVEIDRSHELELFETVKNIPVGYGQDPQEATVVDEPIHETDGMTSAETVKFTTDEIEISDDDSVEPIVEQSETIRSIEIEPAQEVSAPMFGSAYSDPPAESGGKGFSKVLFAIGCVVIGGLIGIAAYHYGFGGASEPVPPPVLESQSENIPFSAFEKNRRNVDADPAAFLKQLPPPNDAEDHYLIARASVLTGDLSRAKTAIEEAAAKIESSDQVNKATLKTEIAVLQAIINDPNALKRFHTEISKPAG